MRTSACCVRSWPIPSMASTSFVRIACAPGPAGAAPSLRGATDFSSFVRHDQLQRLADADERELVRSVQARAHCAAAARCHRLLNSRVGAPQEVFLDFTAINEDMFTLDIKDRCTVAQRACSAPPLTVRTCWTAWRCACRACGGARRRRPCSIAHAGCGRAAVAARGLPGSCDSRGVQGLLSVLLALKKRPHIRVQASSELACTLADELNARMDQEKLLFDFRRSAVQPQLVCPRRPSCPRSAAHRCPCSSFWTGAKTRPRRC